MARLHLFEIHDQTWCPSSLRDALTDFLGFALRLGRSYGPIVPRLRAAVADTGATRIVDLCSGAGGPWPALRHHVPVPVLLTDKYPNRPAAAARPIPFHPVPVDATAVPPELRGFRTLFTSFHHFPPREARAILADAVRRGEGIGVFEVARRAPLDILLIALTWLAVLVLVPFVRPFRWSRLLWTYLPPVLPLVGTFDGIVSCLRAYTPAELAELLQGLDSFAWEVDEVRARWSPLRVTYLIGVPKAGLAE
ncbi:MAG TPA: hypothetical protein VGQ06_07090 [Gemmatimonadales bacterium]|jgi:hypothetical protein|nr:hypothetical protein [Gemmatimonadales bacterium]